MTYQEHIENQKKEMNLFWDNLESGKYPTFNSLEEEEADMYAHWPEEWSYVEETGGELPF